MMEKILIVEDELIVARDIRRTLERAGYRITGVARTAERALAMVATVRPTLVLVDIFLKGSLTGIDLATQLNEEGIPFIYVSANSNQPTLQAAKTTNPYGFIIKPFREKDLLVTIDIARYRYESLRLLNQDAAAATNPTLPSPISNPNRTYREPTPYHPAAHGPQTPYEGLIGKNAAMLRVFNLIQQVAPFDTSVLILGDSGTGKEGVANCIARLSRRSNKPFIKFNCAAVPQSLVESELFGHEKGSFTGATDRVAGKFEIAHGGTLLLDEIGEIPLEMQAKLLRVLQEKEVQRIGSNTTTKVDVRILAATSRNLEKEVAEGRFRLDLYYRLLVFPIQLPPLRERKDDIPPLVAHFLQRYARQTGKLIHTVETPVMSQLLEYDWPGNVRELQHLIERTILMTQGDTIREITLPSRKVQPREDPAFITTGSSVERERASLLAALQQCNFKISGKGGVAELLNLAPAIVHAKIKKLDIKRTFSS